MIVLQLNLQQSAEAAGADAYQIDTHRTSINILRPFRYSALPPEMTNAYNMQQYRNESYTGVRLNRAAAEIQKG